MRKIFAIYKKDISALFVTPVAYVAIALFMFLVSFMVTRDMASADLRDVFGATGLFMIFVIPMATMRTWSVEISGGTHELLLTSPLTFTHIVIGKFLAVMTLILAIFLLTGQYALLVLKFGKPDWGPIATGYIGMFLLCGAFTSIGIFSSSLSSDQFISGIITFVILLFFMLVDTLAGFFSGFLGTILGELAVFRHYEPFDKGLLDLSQVIFFVGFIFIFLFLTVRNLEARRW